MKRRVCIGLCLIVCALMCILWVRSMFVGDTFVISRDWTDLTYAGNGWATAVYFELDLDKGDVELMGDRSSLVAGSAKTGPLRFTHSRRLADYPQGNDWSTYLRIWIFRHGTGDDALMPENSLPPIHATATVRTRGFYMMFPLWAPAVGTFAIGFGWMLVHRRIVRRHRKGACPTCGYDLRATPERCPECGLRQAQSSQTVRVAEPSQFVGRVDATLRAQNRDGKAAT